jgi:hypothetical protein
MNTHTYTHNEADMAFARRLHGPEDVSFNASLIRQAIEAETSYWVQRCSAVERAVALATGGEEWIKLHDAMQEYYKEEHERSVARSEGSRGAPFTDVL